MLRCVEKPNKMTERSEDRVGRRLCLTLIFLLSTHKVCGRLGVNVALNRPAFMDSIYYVEEHGGYFGPWKANDGNRDPEMRKANNSCAHSEGGLTSHWWAVDLGVPLYVAGVLFTNRADEHGFRSDNFIIGLTDVSPNVTAPTLWNYDVCGQYPGEVGDGATVYLKCNCSVPPRRYLIVQLPPDRSYMNFCEISVHIRKWDWDFREGQRMINKVASTFQVDRSVRCMTNCTVSPICDSYNYRSADKTCQLNTHDTPLKANSADIVADGAWRWYSTDFTEVV